MKRTLKRELKVPEIAEKEPMGVSVVSDVTCDLGRVRLSCVCDRGAIIGRCWIFAVVCTRDSDEMALINPS